MNPLARRILEIVRGEETGVLFGDLLKQLPSGGVPPQIFKLQVMASVNELKSTRKVAVLNGLIFPL